MIVAFLFAANVENASSTALKRTFVFMHTGTKHTIVQTRIHSCPYTHIDTRSFTHTHILYHTSSSVHTASHHSQIITPVPVTENILMGGIKHVQTLVDPECNSLARSLDAGAAHASNARDSHSGVC